MYYSPTFTIVSVRRIVTPPRFLAVATAAAALLVVASVAHAAPNPPQNVVPSVRSACAIQVDWYQPGNADHFRLKGVVSAFESYYMTRLSNWPNYPVGYLTGTGDKTYLDTFCANQASIGPRNLYLNPGSTRTYEVSACDSSGDCATTVSPIQVTTPALTTNVPPPTTVLGTGTSTYTNQMVVTFTTSSLMSGNFLTWGGFLIDRIPDVPDLDIYPKYFTADWRDRGTFFYQELIDPSQVYQYTIQFFDSEEFCYTPRLYEMYSTCRSGNFRLQEQTSRSAPVSITVPLRPDLFVASYQAGSQSVRLSWIDSNSGATNETHFRILRNTDDEFTNNNTGNLVELGGPNGIPADTTEFYDSTIQPATRYYYRIRACIRNPATGAEGCSLPRDYRDLYTALVPATNLRAFITYASATTEIADVLLTWQANVSPLYVQRDGVAVPGCSGLSGTRCRDRNVPWRSTPYVYRVGAPIGGDPNNFMWTTVDASLDLARVLSGNLWALADAGPTVGDGEGHGVGWVSANSDTNPGTGVGIRYSVQVDTTGLISGSGWTSVSRDAGGYSHGYGWLTFDRSGLVGCPDAPTQTEPGPPCEARWVDSGRDRAELQGWAKFVQGNPSPAATTYSGWVSLGGTIQGGLGKLDAPDRGPKTLLAMLTEAFSGVREAAAQLVSRYGITFDIDAGFEGAAWGDDVVGWMAPIDLQIAGTGSIALSCPANIVGVPAQTSVQLQWTNPVSYENLTITRADPAPPVLVRSGSASAGNDSVTDNGLTPDTLYTYRFDGTQGNRSCSATYSARTLPPSGPDGYEVTCTPVSATSVDVIWSGQFAGNSPHTARLYGATSSEPTLGLLTQRAATLVPPTPPEVWSAAGTYRHSGLAENEEYRYRLDVTFTGGPRNGETVAYGPVMCRTTPISDAPTNLNATGLSSSTIFVSWRDNATYVHNWELERIKVTPLPSQFTAIPTFINPTTLRFSWQNATNQQTQKSPFYHILERSLNAGFDPVAASTSFSFQDDRIYGGTRTSYTGDMTGIGEGETIYFRTRACSYVTVDTIHRLPGETITPTEVVCSALPPASFYTTTTAPYGPTALSGVPQPEPTELGLQWTDNSNVEDGFEIIQTPPYAPPRIAQLPAHPGTGSVFAIIVGLTTNTEYTFTVRAYKQTGPDRVYSAPATLTIFLAAGNPSTFVAGLSSIGNAFSGGWYSLSGWASALFEKVAQSISTVRAQIATNPPISWDRETYFSQSRRQLLFVENPSGFLDTNLDPGSVYIYRVRATYASPIPGGGTRSEWSNIGAGRTAPSGTGCTLTPVSVRICRRFSFCGITPPPPTYIVNCPGYPTYTPRDECAINNDCRTVGTSRTQFEEIP